MEEYAIDEVVTGDNSSQVLRARCVNSGQAVSLHQRYHYSEIEAQSFLSDSQQMLHLGQIPGVLKTYTSFLDVQNQAFITVLVTEPVTRTMRQEIHSRKTQGGKWTDEDLIELMDGLVKGLEAVHSASCCHGSLSDLSVFLTDSGMWKIGNFESSHFDYKMGSVQTHELGPFLAPECLAYLGNPEQELDWYQADVYSLGVLFLAMAELGVPDWLKSTAQGDPSDSISDMDYKSIIIEVVSGMMSDALGYHLSLRQVECLLRQEKLCRDLRRQDVREGSLPEEGEETYICTFCSENSGTLMNEDYICKNPSCVLNSETPRSNPIFGETTPGSTEASVCCVCSKTFDPTAPWTTRLSQDKAKFQDFISIVCSELCLDVLMQLDSPKKCVICSAVPPPECPFKPRHPEVPSEVCTQLCSFACYRVFSQQIGGETTRKKMCLQCGKEIVEKKLGQAVQLPCNLDHLFCKYKCCKVFSRAHGNTLVLCPICAGTFDFQALRLGVKSKASASAARCANCDQVTPVLKMSCGHTCCMKCISVTSDEIGYRTCPLVSCRTVDKVEEDA